MGLSYITAAEKYSNLRVFLFYYFGIESIFKQTNANHNGFHVIKIPLPKKMKEKRKKRYFSRLCRYLHNQNIDHICIRGISDDLLLYYFKTEFQIITGRSVFCEIFSDILQFFSEKKGYRLNECELVFISNHPEKLHQYLLKSFRFVKNISVYTTNPKKFDALIHEFREKNGIFIQLKGKNDKVKKYNKIYVNCEPDRIVDENFFQSVNLIDIYHVYKGGFCDIRLSYKTNDDLFFKEHQIVKDLKFTEYYIHTRYQTVHSTTIFNFLKEKNYKIVNIKK